MERSGGEFRPQTSDAIRLEPKASYENTDRTIDVT